MTPAFICGFECGAFAAQWTATGTAPTLQTAIARNGGTAARVTTTAAQSYYLGKATALGNLVVTRMYFYLVSLPGATISMFAAGTASAADTTIRYNTTSGKFAIIATGGTAQDGVTSAASGQWYRLDIRINSVANPWVIDWQIDGVDQGTYSPGIAAASDQGCPALGPFSANTVDHVIDDIVVSTATGDYPIGDGEVYGYQPTADGTHTSTSTNIVKGTTATPVGAAITSATTDAFNWVDGPINDTADFWNQQTLSSAQYAEVQFDNTTHGAPRGVETLVALSAATTAAGTQKAALFDGTTQADIYALSTIGVAHPTLLYQRKAWPNAPTGAWTTALFDALRVRWGFSTDATPDMYCDVIRLEAEFAPVVAALTPYVNQMPQLLAQ